MKAICPECNSEFIGRSYKTRANQKYCGITCRNKAGGRSAINLNRPEGERHPLWRGGRNLIVNNPVKNAARYAVQVAIKKGILVKSPCIVCGNVRSEAHHKDYLKKLDIEWLCRVHHRQADYRDGTKSGDFGH